MKKLPKQRRDRWRETSCYAIRKLLRNKIQRIATQRKKASARQISWPVQLETELTWY